MCPNDSLDISKDFFQGNKSDIIQKRNDKYSSRAKYLWSKCIENPGHEHFIPANEFKITDLPEKYRNAYFLNYILRLAIMTVRIVVNIKHGRPVETEYKHGSVVKVGTRTVIGTGTVIKVSSACQRFHCECQHCLQRVCGDFKDMVSIFILTACHVVSDCWEAQNSTVDFFYDDDSDTEKIKTLPGVRIFRKNADEDWSVLECETRDQSLVKTLQPNADEIDSQPVHSPSEGDLAVIVSHPHGRSKHISIGHWKVDEAEHPAKNRCIEEFFHILSSIMPYVDLPPELQITIAYILLIFRRTIFNSQLVIVNKANKSEATDIECDVMFPDETKSMCHIWLLEKPVKDTKKFLLMEGNIHDPENDLYLEMELPDGQTQIMDDEKDLYYYWDDLQRTHCIRIKKHSLYTTMIM